MNLETAVAYDKAEKSGVISMSCFDMRVHSFGEAAEQLKMLAIPGYNIKMVCPTDVFMLIGLHLTQEVFFCAVHAGLNL